MKIYVAAFSDRGRSLVNQIEQIPLSVQYGTVPLLCEGKWVEGGTNLCVRQREPLEQWTAKAFAEGTPIVFVGAMGIAARAVAPSTVNKKLDSPVLVVDECGKFVIPLLSGHLGGANELANQLAAELHAQPVITTATDVNGLFAADVFARRNNLSIVDTAGIAKVSAKLLRGESIRMAVEGLEQQEVAGMGVPESVNPMSWSACMNKKINAKPDIAVCSVREASGITADLVLTTRDYVLGIGCKKGKSVDEMLAVLRKAEEEQILRLDEIAAIASIDVKRDEPGLLELAQRLRRPFCVFDAEELMALPGTYTASGFVKQTVGVDNVCERAAVAAAGGGRLVVPKRAGGGMTFAVAQLSEESRRKRRLDF